MKLLGIVRQPDVGANYYFVPGAPVNGGIRKRTCGRENFLTPARKAVAPPARLRTVLHLRPAHSGNPN